MSCFAKISEIIERIRILKYESAKMDKAKDSFQFLQNFAKHFIRASNNYLMIKIYGVH